MMRTVIDDLIEAFGCRSQTELAEILGVHFSTVSTWKRQIPIRRIHQIESVALRRDVALPPSFHAHKANVLAAISVRTPAVA